ncbi:MAG: DUF952 domain-containing protein [Bacteroidota bacterium]
MNIYHLLTPSDWIRAQKKDQYAPSSLQTEGFIHCSTEQQLFATASRYYAEEQELRVFKIEEKQVKTHLKWEKSFQGDLFPHIYRAIHRTDITATLRVVKNHRGEWGWAD